MIATISMPSRMQRLVVPALALIAAGSAALLGFAYYVDTAAAHSAVVHVYMDDAALRERLETLFPVGAPRRDIEYYLSNTPIWHDGYDPETRQIVGSIRPPQRLLFAPTRRPIQVVLQFDENEVMASVYFTRSTR